MRSHHLWTYAQTVLTAVRCGARGRPGSAAPDRSIAPAAPRDRRGARRDTSSAPGARVQEEDLELTRARARLRRELAHTAEEEAVVVEKPRSAPGPLPRRPRRRDSLTGWGRGAAGRDAYRYLARGLPLYFQVEEAVRQGVTKAGPSGS